MSPRGAGTLTADAVVDAAARLADRDGLGALTLAGVAAEVGVKTPSLYHHVGGLDDLHRLLALRSAREIAEVLAGATVGRARDDALTALGHAYRRWAREHPGRYAAIQRAVDPGDAERAAASKAGVDVAVAVLRGYGLEGDDAIHATRVVRSALHGFVTLEGDHGFGIPLDLDETFTRLLRVLTDGIASASA